jgi:hypothetical protein
MRTATMAALACLAIAASGAASAQTALPAPHAALTFTADPLTNPRVLADGDVLARFRWNPADAPAFPGDRPGSLSALYDSSQPAARLGLRLASPLDQDDAFTAAAILVLREEGFWADPHQFFQVSWGLWNSRTTGWERVAYGPGADTFDLLEADWFPNVHPLFGGPYLSAALFGAAHPADPLFPAIGAFANAVFDPGPVAELPLGVPLLVLLEHRPADGGAVVSVHRIGPDGGVLPVPGAVGVVPLERLARRAYELDVVGLTLWHDPFGSGDPPAIDIRVDVHLVGLHRGVLVPREALRALAVARP